MSVLHDASRFSMLQRFGAFATLLLGLLLIAPQAIRAQLDQPPSDLSPCSISGCPPGMSTLLYSGTQTYSVLGGSCTIDVT